MLKCVFLLFSSSIFAMLVGNPAEPALMDKGIIFKPRVMSFRLGYTDDWVYKQRFQDEFTLQGERHTRTFSELSTYAGIATINFVKRLDIYAMMGSSRMQIDDEIFTKRAFAWSVGSKLVFLKSKNFYFGLDAKYFQTDQKPKYFVIDGEPFNIVTNYKAKYQEIQAALGMAYRTSMFSPYINGTYILTHIEPDPAVILVRFPDSDELVDLELKSVIGKKHWGMALGLTLIDISKATLALEWRVFNQNAVNVNGEIRF
jgi:hypothetical protein